MKWMITDSGLGGLSVCAGLEKTLQQNNSGAGIELLYVNATPDDRIGYNALKTQAERIELFDTFLHAAYSRFHPDEIAIACNTLSVIYDQTSFSTNSPVNVRGIVDAGVELCNQNMRKRPNAGLIVFATETTTEAGTYPRLIEADSSRVVPQECPELAHAISNDASGAACRTLLQEYVRDALKKFPETPEEIYAFLGCTHYGYQEGMFEELLANKGSKSRALNPNDLLVKQLVNARPSSPMDRDTPLRVKFISRYSIPEAEIHAMESYLRKSAPLTLAALRNQLVIADLFDPVKS